MPSSPTVLRRALGLLPLLAASLLLAPITHTAAHPLAAPVDPPHRQTVGQILVVSVDGLNPQALKRLGRGGAPALHRIIDEGASTLNARTQVGMRLTLPNHTGMVTGRRISADAGGHGVSWNDDRRVPRTVQKAAGHRVRSVFSEIARHGGSNALFAQKRKFSLFARSWPRALDRVVIDERRPARVAKALRRDLRRHDRELRFLHLAAPDTAGHDHRFMSRRYLAAVRRVDRQLGKVLALLDRRPELADDLTLVVTSDHGGTPGTKRHKADRRANYRVPFLVRGPGVPAGTDLYDLNESFADPGRRQPSYDEERQPLRNGHVANLVLQLLGLPSVPGSEHDVDQELNVLAARARSATG